MNYIQLIISLKDDLHEYLIAELHELDFEGFEQEDDLIKATIPTNRFDDFKREQIEQILAGYGEESSILKEEIIVPKNWNEQWERTIQPQTIGKFYVHPTWNRYGGDDDKIELMIDPKMAFGTGYHATTQLMLELLPEVVASGDEVLDAGTGTGILGIASLKLGAGFVFGFDVDEWSETNTRENILLNKVKEFEVKLGSTETIPSTGKYDVILANINRNVLLEIIPDLMSHLKEDGKLLISGLLKEDENAILNLEVLKEMSYAGMRSKQEWIAMLFNS